MLRKYHKQGRNSIFLFNNSNLIVQFDLEFLNVNIKQNIVSHINTCGL